MYVFCVLYETKATQMTYTDRITRCDKGFTNYDYSPLLIYKAKVTRMYVCIKELQYHNDYVA